MASRASEMSVHPGKEDGCTLISIDYQRRTDASDTPKALGYLVPKIRSPASPRPGTM